MWIKSANDLVSINSPKLDDSPKGTGAVGVVEQIVDLREHYLSKCDNIDRSIAQAVESLDYQQRAQKQAIKNNLCYGKSWKVLHRNNRYLEQNLFYATRRKALFYLHLRLLKNEQIKK